MYIAFTPHKQSLLNYLKRIKTGAESKATQSSCKIEPTKDDLKEDFGKLVGKVVNLLTLREIFFIHLILFVRKSSF